MFGVVRRSGVAGGSPAAPTGHVAALPDRRVGPAAAPLTPEPAGDAGGRRRGPSTWSPCRSICETRPWPTSRCSSASGSRNRAPTHRLIGASGGTRATSSTRGCCPRSSMSRRRSRCPGMEGRPATAREMEWLVRRSIGIGLPAPAAPVSGRAERVGRRRPAQLRRHGRLRRHPAGSHRPAHQPRLHEPVERHVAVMSVGRLEEIEAPDPGPRAVAGAHRPAAVPGRVVVPVRRVVRWGGPAGHPAQAARGQGHAASLRRARPRRAAGAGASGEPGPRGGGPDDPRRGGRRCPGPWLVPACGAGRTQDECLERVAAGDDLVQVRRVSIEHPRGQYGLLREFIPGEPVSTSAYRRRLPALYVSAGVPTASSQVGDRRGPYIGYTVGSSRRAVMFDTHYATEVRETSGLVPVVGGLGAGKSVLLGLLTYEAVRRGVPSVVLDPSGPLARLTELRSLANTVSISTSPQRPMGP